MKKNQRLFLVLSLIGFGFIFNVSSIFAQPKIISVLGQPVFSDSLLQKFTVDDLLKLESVLDSQLDSVAALQSDWCSKMINQGDVLIKNEISPEYKPLVLKQLGDLYLLLAENSENDADIHFAFDRVKYYYAELIAHYPGHNATGNALFTLAELTVAAGEDSAEAIPFLRRLILDYPENENIPAAYFWLAEDNRKNHQDNAVAISMYRQILKYPEAPEYLPTCYQLAQLSQKAENYQECIAWYSKLLQTIPREGFYLSGRRLRLPDVQRELKPVLAQVFILSSGLPTWEGWHKKYDWAGYSWAVLAEMGHEWLSQGDGDRALAAFELWLKQTPMANDAPKIFGKKIQAAQLASSDGAYLFDLRQKLLQDYGPESGWWQAVGDNYRDKVRPMVSAACRENILWRELQGVVRQEKAYFEQIAADYQTYFRLFPQDSSLVRMHWNYAQLLENKLILPDSAFAEYLHISDEFWESAYQRQAVERAIQVAAANLNDAELQAILQYPREFIPTREPVGLPEITAIPSLAQQVLSEWEKRYQAALDVYIMLYPHDLETAEKLLFSSIISFQRGYPGRAQKYAQTMNYYFPHSSLADVARTLVIESQFQQFAWPETMAECRRIMLGRDVSDLADYAGRRFAEASYFQALALADSGAYLKAANTFSGIVTFVPDVAFADVALLNAGDMYFKSTEFRRALSMYGRLMQHYDVSENYVAALNGSITCYEKMQQYRNAAISSERLAKLAVDSATTADALQNAGNFYEKSELPGEAVRVYLEYAAHFPAAENTPAVLLAAGELALANAKNAQARAVFLQLTKQYPTVSAAVAGNFYLGKMTSHPDSTKKLYTRAFELFETLAPDAKKCSSKFAADALLGVAQIEEDELRQYMNDMHIFSFVKMDSVLHSIDWAYKNAAELAPQRRFEISYQRAMAEFTFSEKLSRYVQDWRSENFTSARRLEIADHAIQLTQRSGDQFLTNLAYLALFLPKNILDSDAGDAEIVKALEWQDRNREKVFEVLVEQVELKQQRLEWKLENALKIRAKENITPENRFQFLSEVAHPFAQEIKHTIAEGVRLSHRWQVTTNETEWLARQQATADEWYPNHLWREIHEAVRLWQQNFVLESQTHFWDDSVSDQLGKTFAAIQQQVAPETVASQCDSLESGGTQSINFVKNVCLLSAELDSTIRLLQSERFEQLRLQDVLGMTGAGNRAQFCREQLAAITTFKNNWLRIAESLRDVQPDSTFWKNALQQELIYAFPDVFYAEPVALDTLNIDSSWFTSTENSPHWRYPTAFPVETHSLSVIDSLFPAPQFWLMEIDPDSSKNEKQARSSFILRREFSGRERPVNLVFKLHSNASLTIWLNGENIKLKKGRRDHTLVANVSANLFPGTNILVIELQKADSARPFVVGEFVLTYVADPRFTPPLW